MAVPSGSFRPCAISSAADVPATMPLAPRTWSYQPPIVVSVLKRLAVAEILTSIFRATDAAMSVSWRVGVQRDARLRRARRTGAALRSCGLRQPQVRKSAGCMLMRDSLWGHPAARSRSREQAPGSPSSTPRSAHGAPPPNRATRSGGPCQVSIASPAAAPGVLEGDRRTARDRGVGVASFVPLPSTVHCHSQTCATEGHTISPG